MALDLSHIWNNYFKSFEERDKAIGEYILNQFNDRLAKMAKKQEEIDNLNYEKSLIMNDAISILNQDVANSSLNIFKGMTGDLLWKAWKYCHYPKEITDDDGKVDEKKTKEYKACYDYSRMIVENKFFNNNKKFKFNSILMNNYGEYYEFEYTYGKETLEVAIPEFVGANAKSYMNLANGYSLRYVDGCVHHLLTYGFDFEKIRADIDAWCKKVDKEAKKCRKKATNTEKNPS